MQAFGYPNMQRATMPVESVLPFAACRRSSFVSISNFFCGSVDRKIPVRSRRKLSGVSSFAYPLRSRNEGLSESRTQQCLAVAKTGVRQFIDRVFSPNCDIAEESDYEENGDTFTRVFLQSKNPSKDEPDFACSESLIWNHTAVVVVFSPLGSKTGGGIDWPSPKEILMPDGSTEHAFDYPIMQSIRFLKHL